MIYICNLIIEKVNKHMKDKKTISSIWIICQHIFNKAGERNNNDGLQSMLV